MARRKLFEGAGIKTQRTAVLLTEAVNDALQKMANSTELETSELVNIMVLDLANSSEESRAATILLEYTEDLTESMKAALAPYPEALAAALAVLQVHNKQRYARVHDYILTDREEGSWPRHLMQLTENKYAGEWQKDLPKLPRLDGIMTRTN